MVAKIQLAALSRADIPESERLDHYVFIDEFHNLATRSFVDILPEIRKYRVSLTLAHQYINQLVSNGDPAVRDAVFGTVGTIVCFRVGPQDAEFLRTHFEPAFSSGDLVNLDKHCIYLQLAIDGLTTPPFSAASLPPLDLKDTEDHLKKILRISRERYGKPCQSVETRINRKFSL